MLEFSILYATAGIGAVAVAVGVGGRRRPLDLLFVLALWPLYLPLMLDRDRPVRARALLAPHRAPLPAHSACAAVDERVSAARSRLADIDRLLSADRFCLTSAKERRRELSRRGASGAAIASVDGRIATIGRLAALRRSLDLKLQEIEELRSHLVAAAELSRVSDEVPSIDDLADALLARSEVLAELAEYEEPTGWR